MKKPESKTVIDVRRSRAKAFRQVMSQPPEQWSKQERDLIARAGLSERVRSEPPRRKKAG